MIEVRNNKEFLEAIKKAEKNTLIFYDEAGTDIKYGKSKYALELAKEMDKAINKIKKRRGNFRPLRRDV